MRERETERERERETKNKTKKKVTKNRIVRGDQWKTPTPTLGWPPYKSADAPKKKVTKRSTDNETKRNERREREREREKKKVMAIGHAPRDPRRFDRKKDHRKKKKE